ncbi:vitamin K epoxide reductase family protein [Nocardia sp. CNY236]|uniref:vitamin K epoxide reductase family protein n=1 Tax=Nocardia sp. CNY236 TaxID=1169152 RepID=UPI000411365C|nr:vitamin K epoxide reductase family protein [Nocardia sp. CNY236]
MKTDSDVSIYPARQVAPWPAWSLLIGGVIGWVASLALTIEKFNLLTEPGYIPSCSLNPIVSCGSVIASSQAAVFGFPNPIIGVVGFSVVVTVGVQAVAGAVVPRWIWSGLWLGVACGVGFVCWLIFQALYRINALCPYCMVVWAVTPALLAVVTGRWESPRLLVAWVTQWRWTMLVVFYAVVTTLVFVRFQDYWLTLV